MSQSPRTNRSAMRTRDGVTFWAPSSFWDSASFCQCPVSSASLSPFLSLSWILSMSLCAPRNSADAANLKKSNFRRMRSQALPPLSRVPAGYLQKFFTRGRKALPAQCPAHTTVWFIKVFLCSSLHHLFTLPSCQDLAGKCMLFSILTQRR